MDTKKLWESALAEIELEISKANFSMWFKDTRISRVDDGMVYLSVPNVFIKDWLNRKFHKLIVKCLRNHADIRGLEYMVSKEDSKQREVAQQIGKPIQTNSTTELPLSEYYINKE